MSEEEKEAYNYLSQIMFDDETTEKYVNTLLGLIENQEKEIEELKAENEELINQRTIGGINNE